MQCIFSKGVPEKFTDWNKKCWILRKNRPMMGPLKRAQALNTINTLAIFTLLWSTPVFAGFFQDCPGTVRSIFKKLRSGDTPNTSWTPKLRFSPLSSKGFIGFMTMGNVIASCHRGTESITEGETFRFHSIEGGLGVPTITSLAQAMGMTSAFAGFTTSKRPHLFASLKALSLQLPVGVSTYYLCRALARQTYRPGQSDQGPEKLLCEQGELAVMTAQGEIQCLSREEAEALLNNLK